MQRNIRLAFGFIDAAMLINNLGYAEVEKWKDAIFRSVGERTAINYCRAVKAMLDFAHKQATIPYRHCEDFSDLFSFKKTKRTSITPYNADQLNTLLARATDRERLYVYLALNCGHTQVDIGNLKANEIIQHEGQWSIVRRRDKTSHQNDFESLHVLWPETYALLKKQMATPNKDGFALLNSEGKRLYINEVGTRKYDAISDSFEKLKERSGVAIAFKQFRKMGMTATERLGGTQPRRLYKAGTIDGGDKVYVLEAFQNLTPVLLKWGDELRADGVLR
jgi:hypothetical protein